MPHPLLNQQKKLWSNLKTQLKLFRHKPKQSSRVKKTKTWQPKRKKIKRAKRKSLSTNWRRTSNQLIMTTTRRLPITIGKWPKLISKKEEIRKLEDTHQALTKDALQQAKSGASMKKVQHNLKIAKSVAKRVEDLKQQVQSDQQQLQKVSNE
jgi:DNA repair ATPase RecN